jgi:ABC-2 type transport system ATP-binding protein
MKNDVPAIEIRGLHKRYGDLEALKGIDLHVEEGKFFGLLGPNGAGKTTSINIMTGLANKTAGEVRLFGHDLIREYRRCRLLVGLVPQEFNFDLFAKVHKILEFQAGYFGVTKSVRNERAERLMAQFGLLEKRNTPSRFLSGGMKRRLLIARALMHEPTLLILDEPTAGVDVELRRSLWAFLREINGQGTTILLTTHYIEEAESLCDTIAIIDHGRIIDQDSTRNMANRLCHESIVVTSHDPIQDAASRALGAFEPKVAADGYQVTLTFNKEKTPFDSVLKQILASGIQVANLQPADNRLEQVFLHLTTDDNGNH